MKKATRFMATLLAATMVVGMTTTVFATTEGSVTPETTSETPETTSDTTTKKTLTINAANGHTYYIYQLLKGDISATNDTDEIANAGTIANAKAGSAANFTDAGVADFITNCEGLSGQELGTYVQSQLKENATETAKIVGNATDANQSVSVETGYYLIVDTWNKDDDGKDVTVKGDALSRYMVVVNGDTTMNIKSDAPEVEKKIDDGGLVDVNEASIGDTVHYQITGTLPSTIADYEEYYVSFNDTLSKGLDFTKGSVKVTIDGVDVTNYFSIIAGDYSETNGTKLTIAYADVLNLEGLTSGEGDDAKTIEIGANEVITVTYDAVLNDKAVVAGAGNPNTVNLDYSNNPDNSGDGTERPTTPPEKPNENPVTPTHPTGETPDDTVKTYTTEITVLKNDQDGNILKGAEFELSGAGVNKMVIKTESTFVEDAEGTYYLLKDNTYTTTAPTIADDETDNTADYENYDADAKKITKMYSVTTTTTVTGAGTSKDVKAYVGEDGKVTFTGLGQGTYTLTETDTPEGYNTIKPVSFTVDFSAADEEFTVSKVTTGYTISVNDSILSTTIVNNKGTVLPSTGGIGTTIFYVVGTLLVLGAGVVLVAKKRIAR